MDGNPITKHIKEFTVGIRAIDGTNLGTGTIVTTDGIIVTCFHVIKNKDESRPPSSVKLYFSPEFDSTKEDYDAEILADKSSEKYDIAFLQSHSKSLPDFAKIAPLSLNIQAGNSFRSFGFREIKDFEGLPASGLIDDLVSYKIKRIAENDQQETIRVLKLNSSEIAGGMSGGPIYDTKQEKVVGIASNYNYTEGNIDRNLAIAIPVETIVKLFPDLYEKNSGLQKISRFLEMTGLPDKLWNRRIDDLYIPPAEYPYIKEILQGYKVVLITGTKEYGKTYTAERLLWEYFRDSEYIPKYIKETERERINELEDRLEVHNIIYIEDPFGKTKFIPDEDLSRLIPELIGNVMHSEDTYLIITSREEIFKQFHPIGIIPNLSKIKINLSIKDRSYDYDRREQMLLKWSAAVDSAWLNVKSLKKIILERLKDERNLPTPLSIKDFAIDREIKEAIDEALLVKKMDLKSKATADAFGVEISNMPADAILFLSFPLITYYCDIDYVERKYNKLSQILSKRYFEGDVSWRFSDLLEWFKFDKINYDFSSRSLSFSHPSYSESVDYVLSLNRSKAKDIVVTVFEEIAKSISSQEKDFVKSVSSQENEFVKSISSQEKSASGSFYITSLRNVFWNISSNVVRNYDKLPSSVKDILSVMIDNNMYGEIAHSVFRNYDRISSSVRDEILFKLEEKSEWSIIYAVKNNTQYIPDNILNELILKFSNTTSNSFDISGAIIRAYNRVQGNVRKLLFNMADDEPLGTGWGLAWALIYEYEHLPERLRELLFKMANNEKTTLYVAEFIAEYYISLPKKIQDLLLEIIDRDNELAANDVGLAGSILEQYDKLPKKIQDLLLKSSPYVLSWCIFLKCRTKKFDDLPYVPRNLLYTMTSNKSTLQGVVRAFKEFIEPSMADNLPKDLYMLLRSK